MPMRITMPWYFIPQIRILFILPMMAACGDLWMAARHFKVAMAVTRPLNFTMASLLHKRILFYPLAAFKITGRQSMRVPQVGVVWQQVMAAGRQFTLEIPIRFMHPARILLL